MKKPLLTTTLVVGLFFTSTAIAGEQGKGEHFGHSPAYQMKLYKKLDLTKEQKKELRAIFKAAKSKKDKRLRFQAREAFLQKQQVLIQADNLDKVALGQLADEQAVRMKQNFIKISEIQHKAWQVLTPEQKVKAKELIQKRYEKRMKRYK